MPEARPEEESSVRCPRNINWALPLPIRSVADLPDKTILDEMQRVPGLFPALKSVVDSDRQPGRFILTGSANLLLVPKLADSLAGRMEIIRLHLARPELNHDKPLCRRTLIAFHSRSGWAWIRFCRAVSDVKSVAGIGNPGEWGRTLLGIALDPGLT